MLSSRFEVIAPIAPGFEGAPMSPTIRSARDLALLYRSLLAEIVDEPVPVVGISFGAWIATEMAVMGTDHIARLGLMGPIGLRFGPPELRNFADLFALGDEELTETLYRDPSVARTVNRESTPEAVQTWARNREALALYGWEPYLHTPRLQRWTQHLRIPSGVIYGEEDRFVAEGYFEKFAAAFSGCALLPIPNAGHFPHLDAAEPSVALLEALFS